jgi:hypothetical protein
METCAKRLRIPAISLILAALVLLPSHVTVKAGDPHGAHYDADPTKVFWFLHASDLHVGMSDSIDTTRLQWLVTTARSVITPSFIVVTGDLTDSTNGNWLGIPNGPYQAEWDQYRAIVDGAGAGPDFFYDIPGNHDAYNDRTFAYYRANSVQGRATGGTQVSWTREFPFGTYHFLGVNSAGNDGRAFSLFFPYGDYAGLDSTELAFVNQSLSENSAAALTFAFGHHPVTDTGEPDDTWLFYGHQEFVQALDTRGASTYNFGHTHRTSQALFRGNSYTGLMSGDGLYYYNVASLSKDSPTGYSLVAVDTNGVSSITNAVNAWPLLLITAPLDRYIGGAVNPYAYTVPAASTNFVRALVFDQNSISLVRFRIDGGATWYPMSRVGSTSPVWQGAWDASALPAGNHTIEVQATGTTTVLDVVTVEVIAVAPPPATDTVEITAATYTTRKKSLSVSAKSSAAPDAALTVFTADGSWPMTYKAKTKTYTLTVSMSSPPQSVTVRSDKGGTATKAVTIK